MIHGHAGCDQGGDRRERRLDALPLAIEADDQGLALAEDAAKDAGEAAAGTMFDEHADAVIPGLQHDPPADQATIGLFEDGARASFAVRRIRATEGVRIDQVLN